MKTISVGCLGLVIGLIVGAALVYLALYPAPKPTPSAAVPIASTRPELAINVNASYAASQIQQVIRQGGLAKNATTTFGPPNLIRVATTVDVSVLGVPLSVNATIAMRVTVQKARIVLTTDSVDAGGFAISPSLVNSTVEPGRVQAEEEINRVVQRALQGYNLRISNIRMTAEDLNIELSQ